VSEVRLTRDAWLLRPLEVLRDEGIQDVKVERLARDLGVTKGSFYWHFNDHGDVLQSILGYWVETHNDVIIKNRDFLKAKPADRLLSAITRVREEGLNRYELAMRAWADHDSNTDTVVRAVYEKHKALVRGFITRLGFRELDAEIRTRLTHCYLRWEPNFVF
jgi:AcrR family transcriptional regulator